MVSSWRMSVARMSLSVTAPLVSAAPAAPAAPEADAPEAAGGGMPDRGRACAGGWVRGRRAAHERGGGEQGGERMLGVAAEASGARGA